MQLTLTDLPNEGRDWIYRGTFGLEFQATICPDGPVLETFFKGYDTSFVLPEEKEDLEGFRACLRLGVGNTYLTVQKQFGAYREFCGVFKDTKSSKIIGGANAIVGPNAIPECVPFTNHILANLNYIYILPQYRGQGWFRRAMRTLADFCISLFDPSPNLPHPLIFLEQNDPLSLSDSEYQLDSDATGLDQFDRLLMWGKLGAKIIEHDYIQPPLSPNHSPGDNLLLGVIGAEGNMLNAAILHAHLVRFFGVSVLKAKDPLSVPVAAKQLSALAAATRPLRLFLPHSVVERARSLRGRQSCPLRMHAFLRELT